MRRSAVAGRFYPRTKNEIKETVKNYLDKINPEKKQIAKGAIVPHAGYPFSGEVAAKSIASLKSSDTFIIIGPSHQGTGTGVSLSNEDWKTPLGEITTNEEIIEELKGIGVVENQAHFGEHSIEVQLPILQCLYDEFDIVPVMLSLQEKETALELGEKIKEIMEKRDVALIGSSDFTHYQKKEVAEKKDKEAIEKIMELDVDGFFDLIKKENLSICGYGPIGVLMKIAKEIDLVPELLEYRTSAAATGDTSQVVGYASIIFK